MSGMDLGLKDKVVIITGGSGGIGRETALAFAAEGARVVVADLNVGAARVVAGEIGGEDRAVAVGVDVSDKASVTAMFESAVRAFGGVDVLVNGAGIFHRIPIDEITVEQWDQLMAINLRGVLLCCQGALNVMKPRRSGCIVNIASMGGQLGGIVAGADYTASKAAILCLTKSLAKNAGPFGIRVNAVNPGVIVTPMTSPWGPETLAQRAAETPLGRNGEPEEVAGAIVFLASRRASFIHGSHVDINGGIYMD
jgi:3-oxoacyl-[acyl-carrier protein] reductase